jgi:hypothetical protein
MPPKLPSGVAARPVKPIVRGQEPDALGIRIPTPEELGVDSKLAKSDSPIDWSMVERRLDSLGATSFQLEKTATGFQFSCRLPLRTIVGRGATKGEAVRHALALVQN